MAVEIELLRKNQIYKKIAAYEEIESDLSTIKQLDKDSEKQQQFGTIVSFVGGCVTVLGVFFCVVQLIPVGIPLIVVGIIGFVTGFFIRGKYHSTNFEDRRYQLLQRIIHTLKTDMAVGAEFQIHLNLGDGFQKKHFVSKGKVGPWTAEFFEDRWLEVSGRFKDGTAFQLAVTQLGQNRSRWATSRSGKSKYKSKKKVSTAVQVNLRPKESKYPNLPSILPTLQDGCRVPEWCELKWARPTSKGVAAKLVSKVPWEVSVNGKPNPAPYFDGHQMILMLFMSLYQTLNRAKVK